MVWLIINTRLGVIFLLMSFSNFFTSLAYLVTSAERVLRDDERDKTSSKMKKFKGYN